MNILSSITRLGFAALILAFLGLAGDAMAAGSEDPDWPCIQRKVPQISAGMVWAGPPVEAVQGAWRNDVDVAQLARKISARATDLADAKRLVGDYAASLGGDKNRSLTVLFDAALAIINAERGSIISGIQRYNRRQRALAERIEALNAALNAIPVEGDDNREARDELLEQIHWDSRIFDEREQSLTYICEQPVLLEQRIFALGREIMNNLD